MAKYHKKQGQFAADFIFFLFDDFYLFTKLRLTISWSSVGAPVQWAYGCRWYFSFFSSFFSGIRERGTCRSYNKDRPLTVFPESDKCFQVTRILRSGWGPKKVPPSSCLRWKRLRSILGFRCNLCVRNAYPVCTLLASYWGHDWESNKPCISHSLFSFICIII